MDTHLELELCHWSERGWWPFLGQRLQQRRDLWMERLNKAQELRLVFEWFRKCPFALNEVLYKLPPKPGCMLGNTGGFWAGDEPSTGPNMFLWGKIRWLTLHSVWQIALYWLPTKRLMVQVFSIYIQVYSLCVGASHPCTLLPVDTVVLSSLSNSARAA